MNWIWDSAVMLGIFLSGMILLRSLRTLRQTTLVMAWSWSALAMAAWALTWFTDRNLRTLSASLADHAWYGLAVLSLCPPIAVLGSRRPGARVWTWFILFPMILVLGWPVGSLWLQGSELRGLHLENPQLAAFCLVLIMGIGNYCGTRHTLAALLYGASVVGIVLSLSEIAPLWLINRSATRLWCSCLMVLAVGSTAKSSQPAALKNLDQLWFDFFDTFGIVWGRRIQDRVNFQISKEQLPIRLELDGFRWSDGLDRQTDSATLPTNHLKSNIGVSPIDLPHRVQVEARVEQIVRWLLRRFVNPAWIDQRLKSNETLPLPPLTIDS